MTGTDLARLFAIVGTEKPVPNWKHRLELLKSMPVTEANRMLWDVLDVLDGIAEQAETGKKFKPEQRHLVVLEIMADLYFQFAEQHAGEGFNDFLRD
jgi:hypothetical protein